MARSTTGRPAKAGLELVGRQAERDQLRALVAQAEDGQGRIGIVRGEAGIGKTRLVRDVLEWAAKRGALVRVAEAQQLDQTRPFGVLCDALGLRTGASDKVLADLARAIVGKARWAGTLGGVPLEVHLLIDELVDYLERLCEETTLVIALESLHWADGSTVGLLRRLIGRLEGLRLALLLSCRPTRRAEVDALIEMATEHGGEVADLGPLSIAATCALAGQIAGGPPGPRLTDELGRAKGNPLLVVEMAANLHRRGLIEIGPSGEAEIDDVASPVSLDGAILHRLGVLPADTIELLRHAAVFGRTVDPAELALMAGTTAAVLAGPLSEACQVGVLEERHGGLAFRHDLIQEALYRDWPLAVRRSLHREIGVLLAGVGAPAQQVAYHLALGANKGDAEAIGWIRKAALELARGHRS